jgi:RNA polymerase sigma-70 factor (ECF subfamily)
MNNNSDGSNKLTNEAELAAICQLKRLGWETQLVNWLNGDGGWLLRRCVARLGSAADAEDALQDITLKLMGSIERFEGRSALRTWVIRIADNHCYTLLKRRNRFAISDHLRHSISLLEEQRHELSGLDEDTEHQVSTTLHALSDKNKEILRLRFFRDQSLDDMAMNLGLSLSATKMRLYRALDAFEKKYVKSKETKCDFDRFAASKAVTAIKLCI